MFFSSLILIELNLFEYFFLDDILAKFSAIRLAMFFTYGIYVFLREMIYWVVDVFIYFLNKVLNYFWIGIGVYFWNKGSPEGFWLLWWYAKFYLIVVCIFFRFSDEGFVLNCLMFFYDFALLCEPWFIVFWGDSFIGYGAEGEIWTSYYTLWRVQGIVGVGFYFEVIEVFFFKKKVWEGFFGTSTSKVLFISFLTNLDFIREYFFNNKWRHYKFGEKGLIWVIIQVKLCMWMF